jgi:Protein of unknown function (DUF3047)
VILAPERPPQKPPPPPAADRLAAGSRMAGRVTPGEIRSTSSPWSSRAATRSCTSGARTTTRSTISKEVRVDVKQFPILVWRWKVVTLPRGGNSRRETDDQAAQVYATFPRFPTAFRSRIIGYVWDTTAPAGTIGRVRAAAPSPTWSCARGRRASAAGIRRCATSTTTTSGSTVRSLPRSCGPCPWRSILTTLDRALSPTWARSSFASRERGRAPPPPTGA